MKYEALYLHNHFIRTCGHWLMAIYSVISSDGFLGAKEYISVLYGPS
jgi:transketolase N-terminal domain/subunit